MREQRMRVYKVAAAGALLLAAVVMAGARWRGTFGGSEEGVRAYFYDLSERRLYAAARWTLPPDDGVGGEKGDGVRAVVVAPRAGGKSGQRIAYLETYTCELRARLFEVQGAKERGRGAGVKGPSGDDPYVRRNTLVRRENEAAWYDLTTPEARRILVEWQEWRDAEGRMLRVVTP